MVQVTAWYGTYYNQGGISKLSILSENYNFEVLLREGLKKPNESVIMIIPRRTF